MTPSSCPTNTVSTPVRAWLHKVARGAVAVFRRPLHSHAAPLAIIALCVVAFGTLIPWLGFYWDDWETILVAKLFPTSEFWHYFPDDRPLAGWTYVLFSPLVGTRPLSWHLFSLALRCFTVLAMWWVFRMIWPSAWRQVTKAALLFAVYPVFFKQPIAVAFHQHWTGYLLYFVSIGAMLLAIRNRQRRVLLLLGSTVAMCLHLAIFEYFAGVELLRPILLWLYLGSPGRSRRDRLGLTLKAYLPYLTVLAAFAVWRIGFSIANPTGANTPSLVLDLGDRPFAALARLAALACEGGVRILLTSWLQVLQPDLIYPQRRFILVSWVIGALVAGVLAIYLRRMDAGAQEGSAGSRTWLRQAFLLGLAAMLLGALPTWLTDGQVLGNLFTDRLGLASMFGASLVWVAATEWIRLRWSWAIVLPCVLIGASVSLHLRVANDYRWSWIDQRAYYWQLYWRAPAIDPSTALIADDDLFGYVHPAFSTNLLYMQPRGSRVPPYWFYSAQDDLRYRLAEWRQGIDVSERARQFRFEASSHDSLVLMTPPSPRCLWVLDSRSEEEPELAPILAGFLELSDISRIRRSALATDYPPEDVFGPEPEHGWCYYFEKADLADQFEDYSEVARLYHEAAATGHLPSDPQAIPPHEWLPFIRAFLHTGAWEQAEELTLEIERRNPEHRRSLCRLWQEDADRGEPAYVSREVFSRMADRLRCEE